MNSARLMDLLAREALAVADAVDGDLGPAPPAGKAFVMGLQVGLTIAITDAAVARQLVDWLDRPEEGADPSPHTIKGRSRVARAFLRALK